jgi:predicted nucleotidyltransferase
MSATPLLRAVLQAMQKHGLEAILIGNAGAAIHGAPVTTLDFDFMIRDTPVNMRKLKAVAKELKAVILRPYYPVSKLFRMVDDDLGLQVDFMPVVDGVKSFNSLRSRASRVMLENAPLLLASLADIVTSKQAAARPRDVAVMEVLQRTLYEQTKSQSPQKPPSDTAGSPRRSQSRKRPSPH